MSLKYLGSVMYNHGGTSGETRKKEGTARRNAVGSLGCIMNGRSVSMVVKRYMRNTITLSTNLHNSASET